MVGSSIFFVFLTHIFFSLIGSLLGSGEMKSRIKLKRYQIIKNKLKNYMAHKTHTPVCEEVHRINEARATSFKLQW